jgi:GGDEF domain-containing protein
MERRNIQKGGAMKAISAIWTRNASNRNSGSGGLSPVRPGSPEQEGAPDGNRVLHEWLTDVLDPATNWYRRWYFLLRLAEELIDARPSERPTSVLSVKIPLATAGLVEDVSERLGERLALIASSVLRPEDFPGTLSDSQLAVLLPGTTLEEARPIGDRLRRELQAFSPLLGVASFPEDGRTALELLSVASQFEGRALVPVINLDDYRRRRNESLPSAS